MTLKQECLKNERKMNLATSKLNSYFNYEKENTAKKEKLVKEYQSILRKQMSQARKKRDLEENYMTSFEYKNNKKLILE